MELFFQNERVQLKDADLLGEGGEARVYRWRDLALKVFHEVPKGDAVAKAARALKVEKLGRFPAGLPSSVIAPVGPLTAKRGEVLGYAMPAVEQAHDFGRLAQRKWREQVVPNAQVQALFRAARDSLGALHGQGVVVGDLNDGNLLFRGPDVFLIDADSMQFGGLPCVVGHERFLDPRLYGADLTSAPRFDAGTDWYAFAVLLFSSLLYVHPFGGTHPKLATLLRRAEARHSVLHADVALPRLASPVHSLPDAALHWFEGVFEKDERSPVPSGVLDLSWSRCACGLEHARAVCPACHALGPVSARPVVRVRGRCTAKVAFETTGRILTAALQGGLKVVHDDGQHLRREDGSVVCPGPADASTRVAVCGNATLVADGRGRVSRVVGGKVQERYSTQVRGTEPVLAASASAAYRQENEWLVEVNAGARVGQVLEGQTWLWTGERLGLGFYRAGGFTFAFLLRTGKPGLLRLEDVSWRGRVVDADAVFDAQHALLSVVTDLDGRETVLRWLFDASGKLLARGEGGARGNAAVMGGRVVLATDQGLVGCTVDQGHLLETNHFVDTQPFVGAGDELLPNTDGSLYVVGTRDITQLSLT